MFSSRARSFEADLTKTLHRILLPRSPRLPHEHPKAPALPTLPGQRTAEQVSNAVIKFNKNIPEAEVRPLYRRHPSLVPIHCQDFLGVHPNSHLTSLAHTCRHLYWRTLRKLESSDVVGDRRPCYRRRRYGTVEYDCVSGCFGRCNLVGGNPHGFLRSIRCV